LQGKINGVDALLVVDSGAAKTSVQEGTLAAGPDRTINVVVGSIEKSLTASVDSYQALQAIEGSLPKAITRHCKAICLLGMNFLSGLAIGFDLSTDRVTFWPGGKLDANWSERWVASSGSPVSLDLDTLDGIWEGTKVSIGDKSSRAIIDTGAFPSFFLSKALTEGSSRVIGPSNASTATELGPMSRRLALMARIGDTEVPWLNFVSIGGGSLASYGIDGGISIDAFRSPRILVDFAARKLYYERANQQCSLSRALSDLTSLPLVLKRDEICIGPAKAIQRLMPYDGAQVRSICGINADRIIRALRTQNGASLDQLSDLARLASAKFSIVASTKKGFETIPIEVDPRH